MELDLKQHGLDLETATAARMEESWELAKRRIALPVVCRKGRNCRAQLPGPVAQRLEQGTHNPDCSIFNLSQRVAFMPVMGLFTIQKSPKKP